MELDEPSRAPSRWRSFGALFAAALAIAAMVAIGIVAAAIAVLMLPIAFLVAWRLGARPAHPSSALSAEKRRRTGLSAP